MGSAILAGCATGVFSSPAEAVGKWVTRETVFEPDFLGGLDGAVDLERERLRGVEELDFRGAELDLLLQQANVIQRYEADRRPRVDTRRESR